MIVVEYVDDQVRRRYREQDPFDNGEDQRPALVRLRERQALTHREAVGVRDC
jgi:hypothetical protein